MVDWTHPARSAGKLASSMREDALWVPVRLRGKRVTDDSELAEAERWLKRTADGFRPSMELSVRHAAAIQDEFNRMRAQLAVEELLQARRRGAAYCEVNVLHDGQWLSIDGRHLAVDETPDAAAALASYLVKARAAGHAKPNGRYQVLLTCAGKELDRAEAVNATDAERIEHLETQLTELRERVTVLSRQTYRPTREALADD